MDTAPTTIDVEPRQLQQRAAVYRLLGRLWLREVEADLIGSLRAPPMGAAFVAAGGTLPDASDDNQMLEQLAIDYCQLFLGPSGHLPPHQSVWKDGHFQGEATVAMRAEFQALGLPLPDGMPDHLGQQLTVMAVILERLAENDVASVTQLEAARRFFVQRLTWTDALCQQAAERAETSFYQRVVTMTNAFLAEEHDAWQAT